MFTSYFYSWTWKHHLPIEDSRETIMEKYTFFHVLVEKLQISFNLIGCILCYVKNLIGYIVFMYVKKILQLWPISILHALIPP